MVKIKTYIFSIILIGILCFGAGAGSVYFIARRGLRENASAIENAAQSLHSARDAIAETRKTSEQSQSAIVNSIATCSDLNGSIASSQDIQRDISDTIVGSSGSANRIIELNREITAILQSAGDEK